MKFPHPLALLTGCIALAAAMTWVLPAGQYQRRHDEVTGREVVVAGSYHRVEAAPVPPFAALVAIPKGMIDAASVIFLVLIAGGAFVVVDRTGALRQATDWLAARLSDRDLLVVPVVSLFFAAGGALENMAEEIIALVPVLLLLTRRLGFQPIVACAMSIGAAAVGSAFSPINPFQVLIAQQLAHLTPVSGWAFRCAFLAAALAIWIGATMRYARLTQEKVVRREREGEESREAVPAGGGRTVAVLLLVLAAFVWFVTGILRYGWGFDEMSAVFFAMGVLVGLVGGLRIGGTASAFAEGFGSVVYAGVLIGFARSIFVVLDQGHVIDTVVQGLFTPMSRLPTALAAIGMMVAQAGFHTMLPSMSGQAVITMPVLVPLADLGGMSRQVVVLAYQYGAGVAELLIPTNGALMAVVAAAGVPYDKWLKFAVPWTLALFGLGVLALFAALAVGLG